MSKKLKSLAKASLIMSKTFIGKRQEEGGPIEEYVKEVTFDIKGAEDVIKTPRITLDGSFFTDFLTSGKPEQYEVVLDISAVRTKFEHHGTPDVTKEIVEPDEPEDIPDPEPIILNVDDEDSIEV